jgi:zinc D-Ala-D-Ala carboxypeptidase
MATVKISKHISYKEAIHSDTAIRRGIKNEPNDEQLAVMKELAKNVFEPLIIQFKESIHINSFFRSIALNKTIGWSRTSQHCSGEAIDIIGTNGVTNKQLFDYIKNNIEFDQLIWEFGTSKNPDWVHVSFTTNKPNRKQILKSVKDGNPVYQIMEAGIVVEQPEKTVKTKKKGKKGIVAVKTVLNIRNKPSADGKVVGQLKNGLKIKIISEDKDWYQIKTSKYSGWVSTKYVKLK